MSEYRYRTDRSKPETVGYGAAVEVRLREGDVLLGWLRKIVAPPERGSNWAVYDTTGYHVATADLRGTAANYLRRRLLNTPADVGQGHDNGQTGTEA